MLRASHRQLTTPLRGGGDWLSSGGLEFSAPQVKFFWWTAEMQFYPLCIFETPIQDCQKHVISEIFQQKCDCN